MKTGISNLGDLRMWSVFANAYRLLSHLYAHEEMIKRTDPNNPTFPEFLLARRFFISEVSSLLITICREMRQIDRIVSAYPQQHKQREKYLRLLELVDGSYSWFPLEYKTFRETCDVIEHATVVVPYFRSYRDDGEEDEDLSYANWERLSWVQSLESERLEIPTDLNRWCHIKGLVQIGCKKEGQAWWGLLDTPAFVCAVHDLGAAFVDIKPWIEPIGNTDQS